MKHTASGLRNSISSPSTAIHRAGVVLLLAAASSCGKVESNGIPAVANELSLETTSPKVRQLETLWQNFAAELGLNYQIAKGKTSQDFENELETFPDTLSESRYLRLNEKLISKFTLSEEAGASPVYQTRCARIERVTPIEGFKPYFHDTITDAETPLEGVSLYKFEYILQTENPNKSVKTTKSGDSSAAKSYSLAGSGKYSLNDTNLGDQIVRSAIVSIPTLSQDSRVPLVIYGHGGDDGLSYKELARVFAKLQNRFVIAAPSFPNEPICEKGINAFNNNCLGQAIAKPSGTLKPFDTDANEILGLHDCIARSSFNDKDNTKLNALALTAPVFKSGQKEASENLGSRLASTLKTYGQTSVAKEKSADDFSEHFPVSVLVGASRGSATGLIALAKAGAAYRGFKQNEGKVLLSRFQCGAFLFPPTTFSMGRLRVGLELFIKGQAEQTRFYLLPTAPVLATFFKDYREGNVAVNEMATRYLQIDPLYNIHLATTALRNWSSPELSGKLLFLHGRLDKVVDAEQSRFYGTMLGKAVRRVKENAWGPGIKASIVSFAAPENKPFPTGNVFSDTLYQHGDSVFYQSKSVADEAPENNKNPGWRIAAKSGHPEHYDLDLMNQNDLTPAEVFDSWMKANCEPN